MNWLSVGMYGLHVTTLLGVCALLAGATGWIRVPGTRNLWRGALIAVAVVLPLASALSPKFDLIPNPADTLLDHRLRRYNSTEAATTRSHIAFMRKASPADLLANPSLRTRNLGILLWGSVALVLILRSWTRIVALRVVTRRAHRVRDFRWTTALADVRSAVGVRRTVDLRFHPRVLSPMTFGTFRPVILLPTEATWWPEDEARAVLVHEMVHIRRLDFLVHSVGVVLAALHWFNPLVRWAVTRFRMEAEQGCDEETLGAGVRASTYARALLRAADAGGARPFRSGAIALRPGEELASRIRMVLGNPGSRRRRRGGSDLIPIVLSLLVATVGIAPTSGPWIYMEVGLGSSSADSPTSDVSSRMPEMVDGTALFDRSWSEGYTTVDAAGAPLVVGTALPFVDAMGSPLESGIVSTVESYTDRPNPSGRCAPSSPSPSRGCSR